MRKEGYILFRKPMQMKDLKLYGIPSYIIDIWEENYSSKLLSVQEEAVRNYGVLDYVDCMGFPRRYARNDKGENHNVKKNNLLVVAPTSSGKTFIGEMAAVKQAIQHKKAIYLVPLRTLAEEKYHRFKKMYQPEGIEVVISSRDRKENDNQIRRGDFDIAIMVYEKFKYFQLKYPKFFNEVSLVVIDELQVINDPIRGPLLEEILICLQNQEKIINTICLSAFLDNRESFLAWYPCQLLTAYQRPVELRKGIVREGIFKYVTHNEHQVGEEVFFHRLLVNDNCREDYMLQTVRCFTKKNEPTLLFFPTRAACKKWAVWLADGLDECPAEKALEDLKQMEETLTRDSLLSVLEKGVAYHNSDLSWEERNLVEHYLRSGEIKVVCATTTLAMGINLPFKNVILSMDKVKSSSGDGRDAHLTNLSFTDIENMGGRAGRLNRGEESEFGRVIFLAHSRLSESIYQNLYFNLLKEVTEKGKIAEEAVAYPVRSDTENSRIIGPGKTEKDLSTLLLRLVVGGKDCLEGILSAIYIRDLGVISSALPTKEDNGYWHFIIDKKRYREKIDNALEQLKENQLINEGKGNVLTATDAGKLIIAKGIKVDTYLYFLSWLSGSIKGEISTLEMIFTLSLSEDGKAFSIPFPQFYRKKNMVKGKFHYTDWKEIYRNKLLWLVFELGEEGKEIFCNDTHGLQKGKTSLDDYLAFKKTLLLYDWIGSRDIRSIEQEYSLYRGAVKRLGEGFSWLADSLAAMAEEISWNKERPEDLKKIQCLCKQLVDGVEEAGLSLAQMHIPGLNRTYIRKLVKEGYEDKDCLKEVSDKELRRLLPGRLVKRIGERLKEKKKEKTRNKANESTASVVEEKVEKGKETEKYSNGMLIDNKCLKDNYPQAILQIDKRRPDRIIFEGKEIKVTTIGFSLLYLLAQHRGQVIIYDDILKTLWQDEEDAIYHRLSYHLSKIKKNILKILKEKNKAKIDSILMVIKGRGLMLNLREKELKIIS